MASLRFAWSSVNKSLSANPFLSLRYQKFKVSLLQLPYSSKNSSSKVSVLGSIAAGTPIEAIQHEVDKVALPEDLQKNGEYFGLKVKGDSMIEAGINDGDTVIIKKTSTADTGQIAVVLIDEQEATLKRIRKKGNTIALEAANKNYDTKIYASNRIKIQGRLISLYRNFH